MSATYNWSYRPGVTNKYGIQIADGPDDQPAPNGYLYIALFGNDLTGNGSRQFPYRTISKAYGLGNPLIIGSGVYREPIVPLYATSVYGDGEVIIDGATILGQTGFQSGGGNVGSAYNLTFRNWSSGATGQNQLYDCTIENSFLGDFTGGTGNTFKNLFPGSIMDITYGGTITRNNTIINCLDLTVVDPNVVYNFIYNIFYNCNIFFRQATSLDYSIISNCNVQFGGTKTTPNQYYPNTPPGYTQVIQLSDIQDAQTTAFGINQVNFNNSSTQDPLFNNVSIGDITLSYSSPARNMNYYGSFIGSHSIAFSVKASGTASYSGFDLSSIINLNVSDDSITLIDNTQNAQIDSVVIPNLVQREISNFPSYGFMADRNGEYIDSIEDLSLTASNAGDILNYPGSYLVSVGSIEYNSSIYQPGDRFSTATFSTIFSTSASGIVFEILEAPERHTIMARFDNGDSTPMLSGDNLIQNNWYYVSIGSITYNSTSYTQGSVFKAVDNGSFTDSGTVILALSDDIEYQHYEPGIQPTTNNIGDSRTGDVIRGNGDPNYIRGGLNIVEFPINAKFVQVRYQIKVNNLKP